MPEETVAQNHSKVEEIVTGITDSIKNVQGDNLNYDIDQSFVDMTAFSNFNEQMTKEIIPRINKFETNLMQALISISKSAKEYEVMDKVLSAIVTESDITSAAKGTI